MYSSNLRMTLTPLPRPPIPFPLAEIMEV